MVRLYVRILSPRSTPQPIKIDPTDCPEVRHLDAQAIDTIYENRYITRLSQLRCFMLVFRNKVT